MVEETIVEKIKAFVGYEQEYCDNRPIEAGMIRRFAEAIGEHNPLYRGEGKGESMNGVDLVAPPTFVFEWNHHEAVWGDERGTYVGDLPLPHRFVRAGAEFEMDQPLRPGQIITTRSRVVDVYEKQGSSGRMVFIICESTYHDQSGTVLARQRSTNICWPELEKGGN